MNSQIISLAHWLTSPPGQYMLDWEHEQFDQAVSDIFGYHALQLGFPELNALRTNRMPHQWLALQGPSENDKPDTTRNPETQHLSSNESATGSTSSQPKAALVTDPGALPFPAASLDLIVLAHTLELSRDPHATLREVERVLVPEGRVVITGLNPASLWGMRQRRIHLYKSMGLDDGFLPEAGEFIGYWRLRDWLRLLSFEVESARFGCYRPALTSQKWLSRFDWMDRAGSRWWPIFGAVYFVVAVKRVRGMRLLEPAWKLRKATAARPSVVANRKSRSSRDLN